MLDIDKLNSDIQKNRNDKKETREEFLKNKKQELENNLIKMYEDKLNGVLSSSMYITMSSKIEPQIKNINDELLKIENEKIEYEKFKSKIPDYRKQIKHLLDIENPSRELILTIIDKIVIDEDKNIEINFKFNIVDSIIFKYNDPENVRNPYGCKGK